jgi:HlyD family secretion protein
MMKKKIVIAIIIALAIVIAIVIVVKKKGDNGTMKLSGNVEATEANVGFKMPGRVVALLVDEGSKVKAGDLLARLDSAEVENLVSQQKAALEEAATRLAELRAGSRIQEKEQAKANVSAVDADLVRARKDFERARVLFENGAISAAQYDLARSAFEGRQAQRAAAAEGLSLVNEGPRKEDIKMADQRVQQARAALGISQEKLKDTFLYAPFAGVILRKNVELGETVGAGTPAFTVGDILNPWIKVYVREDKIGLVKLGQKARVSIDSYPKKTYEGTVTFISSEAEFTPKTVQTDEERVKLVFAVKVRVKNDEGDLKPGMPADVRIEVRQ